MILQPEVERGTCLVQTEHSRHEQSTHGEAPAATPTEENLNLTKDHWQIFGLQPGASCREIRCISCQPALFARRAAHHNSADNAVLQESIP